ncbi:MAG: HEAT repeat domain-containing protein [Gammaproteobacteria bacterium]|nr:HEAT repeat domain-containing protein [Gammaproteobacteria bacterium]
MRRWFLLALALLSGNAQAELTCSASFVAQYVEQLNVDPIKREEARRILRDCGDSAANNLLMLLQSDQTPIDSRQTAVNLLSQLAPQDQITLVFINRLKHDPDLTVRRDIARALALHIQAKPQVTAALIETLADKNEHPLVRGAAADALSKLKTTDHAALQAMQQVLLDANADMDVRVDALAALRSLGHLAVEILPVLLTEYLNSQSNLEKTVVQAALVAISKDLVVNERIDTLAAIDQALGHLESVDKQQKQNLPGYDEMEFSLWHAEKYLRTLRWEKRVRDIENIKTWVGENQWVIAGPLYVAWLLLWLLIYRFFPLVVLNSSKYFDGINRFLPNTLSALPVKFFVFIPMLQYRPRVLQAWVKTQLDTAQQRYPLLPLARAHATHVAVQFKLGDELLDSPMNPLLTQLFRSQHSQTNLLIVGEGGSGKSNLAVELGRLCLQPQGLGAQPMLPVILDRDFKPDETITSHVSTQLHHLLDLPADCLPDEMIIALLKYKHIVLLVDHLSELSDATQEHIQPGRKDFLPRALIMTSRREENFDDSIVHVLHPTRLSSRLLADFCDQYLEARNKRKLYSDREFFELCKSIIQLAGQDGITPLLATLYLDQMAYARSHGRDESGPHSIPELMLHYLNTLNRGVPEDERLPDRNVHRFAEALAWLCLRNNFRPMPVREEEISHATRGAIGAQQLNYLQHRLHLIDSYSAAQDQVAFCTKALAEHLAARHVVRLLGKSEDNWKQFIQRCRQQLRRDASVGSFIQAVGQCAQTYGAELQLPSFVVPSLLLQPKAQPA